MKTVSFCVKLIVLCMVLTNFFAKLGQTIDHVTEDS